MSKKKGVICWHDNKTGDEGEGGAGDYNEAIVWVERMNERFPHIAHWVREVEDEKEAETD